MSSIYFKKDKTGQTNKMNDIMKTLDATSSKLDVLLFSFWKPNELGLMYNYQKELTIKKIDNKYWLGT